MKPQRSLVRYALQKQQANASHTYVAVAEAEVVGYYTLVYGQVDCEDARSPFQAGQRIR
ncbi:MAG: hypothetical protein M3Y72_12335 [Acidobacteriota bacterium]|nr:hypothetical protein [Acidobacteriota bacterium]